MTQLLERADSYFATLNKEIEQVVEILKKLKMFSKRSNLLSLYASIESARTFEFKKELDVIVNQIKDLSEQSTESLRTIEDSVSQAKSSLRNVHQIMPQISNELQKTSDDFKPILKGFTKLNESTEKLKELVKEMLRTLERQTYLEQSLVNLEETLSSKIDANLLKNEELNVETEKTDSVVSALLNELDVLEECFIPFSLSIQEAPKTVLKLRLQRNPLSLNPTKTTDAFSSRVSSTIFRGLVEQGMDTNVIPAIAKKWKLSEDGLVWEFILRDDVKFHNGEFLTAIDVRSTMEYLLLGPHNYMFDMIKGAKDFIRYKTKDVEGIKITSNHSIKFELNHPHIPFLRNLGVTSGGIVKETKNGLLGAGPYRLKKWEEGNIIIVEAFEGYFGKKPFCDEIHFVICQDDKESIDRFLDGEFDVIEIRSSVDNEEFLQKKEAKEIDLSPFYIYDIYYIGINVKEQTPFKEKLVRQAANFAVDRKEYIREILEGMGIPAKGVFPPNFSAYNRSLAGYEHNHEKAKALLQEAGFPNGLPGEYIFDIRDTKDAIKGAELLKKHFSEVGIHFKINVLSWGDLLKKVHNGKSLLFSLGWSNDNGDPDSFLYPLFHSKNWGEPGNTCYYKNEIIDRFLDEAATLSDYYKRHMLYQQIEKILVEDAPWIYLYHTKRNIASQPYIRGYTKNPIASERLEDVWMY
jgi:peptide/nickel transport system substrate-binding protein/oligopeptide transport system substrate-binding protein